MNEQELKDQCTAEFIKWMCEYAEGFEYDKDNFIIFGIAIYLWNDERLFPLLIHRAVEGWNKGDNESIFIYNTRVDMFQHYYEFKNYQSQSLTQAECAMLHCLLEIFAEQEESDE